MDPNRPTVATAGPDEPAAAPSTPSGHPPSGRFVLVRPWSGRQVVGVCTAVARATGTDPVLWRVLAAVSVLAGGLGLVGYLIGWLLTPDEEDTGSPLGALFGRGRSSTPGPLTALVAGAVLILLVVTPRWVPVAILAGTGLGYALYRQRRTGLPVRPSRHEPPGAEAVRRDDGGPGTTLGGVTVCAVLVGYGLLMLAANVGVPVGVTWYLGAALAVTGAGLVVGAWFGRARWLIGLGTALTLALAVGAVAGDLFRPPDGEQTWRPASLQELESRYGIRLGEGRLDLRRLDVGADSDSHVTIDLDVEAGAMTVWLPDDVDLVGEAVVRYGDVRLPNGEVNGAAEARRPFSDLGTDGRSGPGRVSLDITVDIGYVEVRR